MRIAFAVTLCLAAVPAAAQSTGTVSGTVRDIQGGLIPGATVRLVQALSGLERGAVTDAAGTFRLSNLPLAAYELHVTLPGFAPDRRAVDVATSVPIALAIVLDVAAQVASVVVVPDAPLLDTDSAGTHHRIGLAAMSHLPAAAGSRGLESVLATFPGFAQNANGAIHPRGAHNQMTYIVDGLPISDQLTGAFANALDASVVQAAELLTGNIPAEFGSKVSGVVVLTSRSGLDIGERFAGDVSVERAGFGHWQGVAQAGGGTRRAGYFVSATGMRTDRFLDQVSRDNLHNAGSFGRAFARADLIVSDSDTVRLQGMGGRSWFEVANLRSQQASGQDQRQALSDVSAWGSHMRMLDDLSTLESTVGFRATAARLTPSAGDTPVTAWQERRLSTLTVNTRYSRMFGRHSVRAGIDMQWFPIREHFTMAITDPGFNAPGAPAFNEALVPHDLTRGGRPFTFEARRTGRQASAFLQSTLRWRQVSVAAGLRYDDYRLLVGGRYLQPRIGISYDFPGGGPVIRASYNRNVQTPPNENLLLSSSEAAGRLAPVAVRNALGSTHTPIRPERQHVYEVGLAQTLGSFGTIDVSAYRKDSHDQQDNNNFFDTGIIFPTTLAAIRVTGVEARLAFPRRRGIAGTVSMTTGRATSTPPFTGGLFLGQDAVALLSSGPFAIDHDQRLSLHGTADILLPRGVWLASSVRFDSGLVANPSDPAAVAADPDFADLLPYVDLDADVPRVRPRTLIDIAGGITVTKGGTKRWSVRAQVTNVTNRTALYNFQSVFVGTRLVQPRTAALRITRHF